MSIEVWDARVTLAWDGHPEGPMDFCPVTVSVDEAADIASDVFGGPVVAISPCWLRLHSSLGPVAWTLSVRAFTEVEAYELLIDTIPPLIADRLHGIKHPATWRLQLGELVPS